MANNEKLYSVWIYDEESDCEQPITCFAVDEDEARKKGELYINSWSLVGGKITKIEVYKFKFGGFYTTKGISDKMQRDSEFSSFVYISMNRYINFDWGDICEEDAKANDEALLEGDRILAVYNYKKTGDRIWIITEADRSVTTVLFPDEY